MAASKRKSRNEDATVAAVLAYARELRDRADSATLRDPHVEPYRPSNDAARKVSQQYGPAHALQILATRARLAEVRHMEDSARADAARSKLVNHQLKVAGEREADRSRLTLGQRLDAALLGLGVLSDVSAVRLDSEPVSGGKPEGGPPRSRRDKQLDDAVFDARRATERLERELEMSRRRLLEREAA